MLPPSIKLPCSNGSSGNIGTSVIVGSGQVDDTVDPRLAVELRLERLAVDLLLDKFDIIDGIEPNRVL
jgi:hypothetical protein